MVPPEELEWLLYEESYKEEDYDALIPEVVDRLDPIFRRVAEERPFDGDMEERH